jgi:RecA/RadA recombinase
MSQPDSGEQALEMADQLVRSNAVDIIAIDSVAALVPRSEIEGEIGSVQGMHPLPCGWCFPTLALVMLHMRARE